MCTDLKFLYVNLLVEVTKRFCFAVTYKNLSVLLSIKISVTSKQDLQ